MNAPLSKSNSPSYLDETKSRQRLASDPANSVWVGANAGTGKTHVLTQRVLRLLLAGTAPERILCLTYTKTAAAEMSKRVFDTLARWVVLSDEDLIQVLRELIGSLPDEAERSAARTLFARAIETPGGLKFQTIHSFAEQLLQRFPLEAGLTPGFRVLDEEKSNALLTDAIDATLMSAASGRDGTLKRALEKVVTYAADERFDDLIRTVVKHPQELLQHLHGSGDATDAFAELERDLKRRMNVRANSTGQGLAEQAANVLDVQTLGALKSLLEAGSKTDRDNALMIATAIAAPNAVRQRDALEDYFLTGSGTARARLMTKTISDASPAIATLAINAQNEFLQLFDEARALDVVEATVAVQRLAAQVRNAYETAKADDASLDFDDLIAKTRSLLLTAGNAAWVLYKLDGGIEHVLVDEAQDTSSGQWDIINALTGDFFSGGGALPDAQRSVFAVGDEKQSIYSFQGAEPKLFAAQGKTFAAQVRASGSQFHNVQLDLSFRSSEPVLDAVDAVFADPTRTEGLTSDPATVIRHLSNRVGHAGTVEIWDTVKPDAYDPADVWSPLEDAAPRAPANVLADRIASVIERMIASDTLHSENRKIRPGDIIILVRKRRPFAIPMVAALKARGIPVAGADRMALTEQIAVADLMAVGDFVTLPEDDLALACVLKSPLFNLTDEHLIEIAPQRKGTLWKALLDASESDQRFKVAADRLRRWRSKADYLPPFEFYSTLLDREGGRAHMLARLPAESADAIDEFLDLAISYDEGEPPSLTGFLAYLREGVREVKRDMEMTRDEVRIMTVHGAKGLEAPIVFLADTCTTASAMPRGHRLIELPGGGPQSGTTPPIVWCLPKAGNLPPIAAGQVVQSQSEREELNRLLYVAMTRARDRLYVAGFESSRGRAAGCWYDLISNALIPVSSEAVCADGFSGRRVVSAQTAKPMAAKQSAEAATIAIPPPDFAKRGAPREPQLAIPLAPSRLEDRVLPDAEGEPVISSTLHPAIAHESSATPVAAGAGLAALRGTLIHALLQYLPQLPQTQWRKAASGYLEMRAINFSAAQRKAMADDVLAIVAAPDLAHVFGPDSRAEVGICAEVPRPKGSGPPLKINGQIDRLIVTERAVTILDYKSNRFPPADISHVAEAYLYQLAAYAVALAEIYPRHNIEAALVWTSGPRLMPIPETVLRHYSSRLWELNLKDIDGGAASN